MAASMLPVDLHREFFSCPLCKETYKDPKVLPCGHSFCRECLEEYVSRSTTTTARLWFLCPVCRDINTLLNRGVAAFPRNDLVQGLAERLSHRARERKRKTKTVEEDSGVDSVVSSVECLSVASCDVTSSHSVQDPDENMASTHERSPWSRPCSLGDSDTSRCQCDQLPMLYCTDCDVMLCSICHSNHRLHQTSTLGDKAEKHRDKLQTTVHDARREILSLKRGVSELGNYKKNLTKSKEATMRDIQQRAEGIREMVTYLEKRMVSEVEAVTLAEMNRTDIQIDHNKSKLTTLESLSSLISKLLKQADDVQMVELEEVLSSFSKGTMKDIIRSEERHLLERPLVVQLNQPEKEPLDSIKEIFGSIYQGRPHVCKELPTEVDLENFSCPRNLSPYREMPSKVTLADLAMTDGKLIRTLSLYTEGSTSVPHPTDLCFQNNGDLVVVDQGNKCVKFYREGAVYKKIYGSDSLFGVAPLPDGNFAITDHTLHIFDPKGRLVRVLRQQPRDSRGVAVANENCVVVSDGTTRCIYILSLTSGTVLKVLTQRNGSPFKSPLYVAVGPQNDIVISDSKSNSIAIFNSSHELVGLLDSNSVTGDNSTNLMNLNEPLGVCVDRSGIILACDSLSHRVLALDRTGRPISTVVEGMDRIAFPQAVAIDNEGLLYVAEKGGKIKVFQYQRPQTNSID